MIRIDGRTLRTAAAALASMAVCLVLVACSGKLPLLPARAPAAPPAPPDVQLSIVAGPDINPDPSGRPSPVLVHVYQLRDTGKFVSAEFDALANQADTTLGAALIDTQQTMVSPGATVVLRLKIDPQTRFLGLVAEFSNLGDNHWRATSALPGGGRSSKVRTLSVHLDAQAVTVVTGKRS